MIKSKENNIQLTKGISNNDLERIKELELKYLDPTTMGTIISVSSSLMDMFGNSDEDEIIELIENLLTEIESLKRDIKHIIEILEEIKVLVVSSFSNFVRYDLISQIQTIYQYAKLWEDQPYSIEKIGEIRASLADLILKSNKAMAYGYAHYPTMMLALTTELLLIKLSKYDNHADFKNETLRRYKQYFGNAINDSIIGSVANVKKHLEIEMDKLEREYPVQIIIEISTEEWRQSQWTERNGSKTYRNTLRITGDIYNGFNFSRKRELIGAIRGARFHREPNDWKLSTESAIIKSKTPKLDDYIQKYNNAHSLYEGYFYNRGITQLSFNAIEKQVELIKTRLE